MIVAMGNPFVQYAHRVGCEMLLFLRAGAYGSELKESPKYEKYVFIQRN